MYRRISRISWKQKQSNVEVLERLGMKGELKTEIINKEIKYFGHIKRHNS